MDGIGEVAKFYEPTDPGRLDPPSCCGEDGSTVGRDSDVSAHRSLTQNSEILMARSASGKKAGMMHSPRPALFHTRWSKGSSSVRPFHTVYSTFTGQRV